MEIAKTIQPGDLGSKSLLEQYGETLVCVRYRIDRIRQKRYKTIELIVEEKPLASRTPPTLAWVKVGYDEVELRQRIKQAGAKWISEEKAWELSYETAKLTKRIVKRFVKPEVQN